jgi:hypothetical protein
MKPYLFGFKGGAPWIDYKETTKAAFSISFVFQLKNFIAFVLHDICVTYPAVAVTGAARPLMKVTAQMVSTTNQFMPVEIPPNIFSSPSENFNLGTLNEDAQGQRKQPVYFNYPCDYGDTIIVTVTGTGTGFVVGCKISGQQYREEKCL